MDPMWQLAVNKISYLNTYKMKLSVIIGVVHMLFGICLSLFNHIHFKKWERIYCEFVPQIVFLVGLFGYLCFMVMFKWAAYGDGAGFAPERGSNCAPAILITFINMFLLNEEAASENCGSVYMFPGQKMLQVVLLLAALISVPIMLLPKPFILRAQHQKRLRESSSSLVSVRSENDTTPITDDL